MTDQANIWRHRVAGIALCTLGVCFFQSVQGVTVDNWVAGMLKDPVRNSQNLCWRNANWTPATAAAGCDSEIVLDQPIAAKKKVFTADSPPPKRSRRKIQW
jgi:hypothetical protein